MDLVSGVSPNPHVRADLKDVEPASGSSQGASQGMSSSYLPAVNEITRSPPDPDCSWSWPCPAQAFHLESYRNLQLACKKTNTLCATLINLRGPDIHVLNRYRARAEPRPPLHSCPRISAHRRKQGGAGQGQGPTRHHALSAPVPQAQCPHQPDGGPGDPPHQRGRRQRQPQLPAHQLARCGAPGQATSRSDGAWPAPQPAAQGSSSPLP